MKAVFPNTFIIGVQKAGTTTLDDWLSRHPQIYCYESLKDVHLFARFKTLSEIEQRLMLEPLKYKGEPVVLQSAVNYIFYPSFLQSIAQYAPEAKLIVILRNPAERAISAYEYFKKMFREKRTMKEALLYEAKEDLPFSKDNSDFTYIEHGFYYRQIKNCLKNFSTEQLLILDYDDFKNAPEKLLQCVFNFLNIDTSFKPDLTAKNITGELISESFQKSIIKENKVKKWVVNNLIDFWFPVTKRKMLKQKLFEINTDKKKRRIYIANDDLQNEDKMDIKTALQHYFTEDTKHLDNLLGSDFAGKWFKNSFTKTLLF